MAENEQLDDSSTVETPESNDTRDIVEQEFNKLEETPEVEEKAEEKTEEQPTEPARNPWKSWKKEAAEEMSKLPDNIQKMVMEREDQFHKGIEMYKEAANFARSIDKAISPYKDYLSQLNVAPDVAFSNLLKTEKTLRTGSAQDKVEMFQKLAHDYGINLEVLAGIPYDAQQAQLKQQLAWTQEQLQASQDFRQSQEDQVIQSQIEDFGTNHELFNEARMVMADLLEKGLATDLQDAYEKALRFDAGLFEKWQAQQQTNAQSQQIVKANQAAQNARQAAVQVRGAPSGVVNQAAPRTTEEAVAAAFRMHGL